MNEQDYSKREIDNMFDNQEDHFKYIREKLDSIETQTKKTNGRVSDLENWKAYVNGGMAIIVTVLLPVVFIVIKLLI